VRKLIITAGVLVAVAWSAASVQAAHKWGLKEGSPDLQSAGHLVFGPDGILFVGDAKGAAVFAIDTQDAQSATPGSRQIDKLNEKLLAVPGVKAPVTVNDLAVNPISGNLYLSLSSGEAKAPALVRIDGAGKLSAVSLENVPFLKANLPNPPEDKVTGEGRRARNLRLESITDLAYSEGKVLVAGMSAAPTPSTVREFPFPFADRDTGFAVEIYHGAHGRVEDYAAIRTFVPLTIDGTPSVLAGFTCTPLVRFPLEGVTPGSKNRGTTLAELGNRNSPLDMIVYDKGTEKYLLVSNTNRGVMKVSLQDINREEGITSPVRDTAGQSYETIGELEGTVQMDRLNDREAVIIIRQNDALNLKTVQLP